MREKAKEDLDDIEDQDCETGFLVRIIERCCCSRVDLPLCGLDTIANTCEEDRSKDEALPKCVNPEPAYFGCSEIAGNENSNGQKDDHAYGSESCVDSDLMIKRGYIIRHGGEGVCG